MLKTIDEKRSARLTPMRAPFRASSGAVKKASAKINTTTGRSHLRKAVPPLENGDTLTQKEFHRRAMAMRNVRAELIGGIVYMTAAGASREHARPLSLVSGFLTQYEARSPGVETFNDATVILDKDNEVQPDVNLTIKASHGGLGSDSDRYFNFAPPLVVEVAASSASIDMNKKLEAYQKYGAKEYLVHLVREPSVKWFVLRNGVYEPLPCDKTGVIRSENFPGLWLNTRALNERDLPAILRTLNKGLASPEHAAFCKQLQAASLKLRKRKIR